MEKLININEINPNIRFASHHQLKAGNDSGFRHLRHYQMIYIQKGKGKFIYNGNTYMGEIGNLFLWPSQVAHRIISSEVAPLTVFGLQFDLTKDLESIKYPISWFSPEKYDNTLANENIKFSEIPTIPNIFYIDNMSFYESLLHEIVKEYRSNFVNSMDICESTLKSLLIYTLRNYLHYNNKNSSKVKIYEIMQFIYENLDKRLSNKVISERFNYHPNHLNRLFNNFTNNSLHQFIIDAKIKKSIEYMQSTNLNLTEISDKLGFSGLHHFSKQFKDKIGIPPSSFR